MKYTEKIYTQKYLFPLASVFFFLVNHNFLSNNCHYNRVLPIRLIEPGVALVLCLEKGGVNICWYLYIYVCVCT